MVTFGDEVTKILRNLCLHFARQDGQDGKTKRQKYGMNETHMVQIDSDGASLFIQFHTWPLERNNIKSAHSKKHIFNGTRDDPTYLSNRLGKGKFVCAWVISCQISTF